MITESRLLSFALLFEGSFLIGTDLGVDLGAL